MFKRLFFTAVGLGTGVALGVTGMRKVEATRRKLGPEHLARVAAGRAGSLREQLAAAVESGRRAAGDKESELRAVYGVRAAQRPVPPQGG